MRILIGLKRCSTCKNVEKILKDKNLVYEYREIDKHRPTKDELSAWAKNYGVPLSKLFNTSGVIYREQHLAERRKSMSEDEQIELLAGNGMLVKRLILLSDEPGEPSILVGRDISKKIDAANAVSTAKN